MIFLFFYFIILIFSLEREPFFHRLSSQGGDAGLSGRLFLILSVFYFRLLQVISVFLLLWTSAESVWKLNATIAAIPMSDALYCTCVMIFFFFLNLQSKAMLGHLPSDDCCDLVKMMQNQIWACFLASASNFWWSLGLSLLRTALLRKLAQQALH